MPAAPSWMAISVRQPYAHLICAGAKRYEARAYPIETGAVLIHASQGMASGWQTDEEVRRALASVGVTADHILPRGMIVGLVNIVRVIPPGKHGRIAKADRVLCADDGATEDYFLHELAYPAFTPPVPCHGQLKVWPVPPRVLSALNGSRERIATYRRRAN